jgi:hypothetical protein
LLPVSSGCWHLGFDTIITSEWGTPNMVNKGLNPEILLVSGYGVWDLLKRRHQQELDLGAEHQMLLDAQLYPEGLRSWRVKLDAKPEGGMEVDPKFFVDFGELRGHQVRLEGGDASSDSYCYS